MDRLSTEELWDALETALSEATNQFDGCRRAPAERQMHLAMVERELEIALAVAQALRRRL